MDLKIDHMAFFFCPRVEAQKERKEINQTGTQTLKVSCSVLRTA